MKKHAMKDRRTGEFEVALLPQLARQRLRQRLASFDAAARQVPSSGVAVLDQEYTAAVVEHDSTDSHRQPAREPPVEMQQPVDRQPSPPSLRHISPEPAQCWTLPFLV